MTALTVFVLGSPRVERDGRAIEVGLRRATALLVYLAVANLPQERERLAGLLWPDGDERAARGRLRRTLHRLAGDLGDDAVATEGDALRLAPALELWLDSREFEAHAEAGLAAGTASGDAPSPEQREHLRRAAALYADDFLAGFSLPDAPAWDEWQFLQREHLRQIFARVLRALVRASRAEAAWDTGLDYARRWLALDPLHESAHRALMQLYALAGQPAAALRQYQECARILAAELGAAPEGRTTELYEAIKARRLAPPVDRPAGDSAPAPAPRERSADAARAAPPPRPRARHLFPVQPTALIGRHREIAFVADRLREEDTRLVTLTGPGGVGKTRLALQVAAEVSGRFADGAAFVGLAPVPDAELVATALARSLGIQQTAERSPMDTLVDDLRERELLLLLDNFEHLPAAAPLVADLLAHCPYLKILTTSRAALHLRGEKEVVVPPLALPGREHVLSLAALAGYAAVALFVERARDARPGFSITSENAAAVAEICRRLDGLPLAIELAAARVKLLSPQALLARLEHRLTLLTGGARDLPARQQTLRDTIAWSYDLLDPAEQALFRRLAVFVGGCDLDAAEAVCAAPEPAPNATVAGENRPGPASGPAGPPVFDLATSLVDKSLLRWEDAAEGEPRLRLLETLREFGLEQLDAAGEAEAFRERHAAYYVDLAERAERELVGPDQQTWFARLDRERGNFRAVAWRSLSGGDAERIIRLGAALWRFWWARAEAAEAREWVNAILGLARGAAPVPILAQALHGAGVLAMQIGEYAVSRTLLDEAISAARRLGDDHTRAHVLGTLGRLEFFQGNYAGARGVLDECLALSRAIGDRGGLIRALSRRGFVDYMEGSQASARALFEEGLALAREAGDRAAVGEFLNNLGDSRFADGDLDGAERAFRDALAMLRELGEGNGMAWALNDLGHVQTARGDLSDARELLGEAIELARRMGNGRRLITTMMAVAVLAAATGQFDRAVRLAAAAKAASDAKGMVHSRTIRDQWATRLEPASRLLGAAAAARAEAAGRALTFDQAVDDAHAWLTETDRTAGGRASGAN